MVSDYDGDELGRAGEEVRTESRRLHVVARAAVARSKTARGEARLARRERLLAVKAREIAQIEKAIQFYVDMADRWREQGNTVMADKLDTQAIVARERLALAIDERDAWPPVI